MDAPAVHTYLILNVGPPLGLIKYKKERNISNICVKYTIKNHGREEGNHFFYYISRMYKQGYTTSYNSIVA